MEKNAVLLINERFAEALENQQPGKKRISRKRVLILSFFLIDVILACAGIWWLMPGKAAKLSPAGEALSAQRASVTGKYRDILTDTEIEEWNTTDVQAGKVFLKLNTQIEVKSGDQAYIRLLNPPYCTYDYQFTIVKQGGGLLYESEVLPPGSVQEYITLNTKIGDQAEKAWVNYSFYNSGEDELAGSKKVAVILDSSR